MTETQDMSISSRVFNPEFIFCSKVKASLYASLNLREPNEQQCPLCVSDNHRSVDWYEDRPLTSVAFSTERSVISEKSLIVRPRRSCEANTGKDIGEAIDEGRQSIIFFP